MSARDSQHDRGSGAANDLAPYRPQPAAPSHTSSLRHAAKDSSRPARPEECGHSPDHPRRERSAVSTPASSRSSHAREDSGSSHEPLHADVGGSVVVIIRRHREPGDLPRPLP
jgi:hypothetical protein